MNVVKVDSGLSDYQLVFQAQDGNNKAFSELVRRYKSFLGFKTKFFFIIGAEKDDVHQEALIGFYKAIRDYRKGKRLNFRYFSELCVDRQIMSAINYASRFKHRPLHKYECLSMTGSISGRANNPLKEVILKEWLSNLELQLQDLSITERKVFGLFSQGLTYEEIASKMNITKKQVDNSLQRVRLKLKNVLNTLEFDE